MADQPKGIPVGDPIWVESLMSAEEWKERYKSGLPSSSEPYPPMEFPCEFKWRKGMGKNLTPEEIKLHNQRIDAALKKAGIDRK